LAPLEVQRELPFIEKLKGEAALRLQAFIITKAKAKLLTGLAFDF